MVTTKDLTTPRDVRFRGVVSMFGEGLLRMKKDSAVYPYFYIEDWPTALWVSILEARRAWLWQGTPADIQA